MTGALVEFETTTENPLTFSDFMNVLRDAATFVDNRLKKIYATRGFFETERSDDESILNEGEGEPETKRNNAITNSLEEKLHQLVQYLIVVTALVSIYTLVLMSVARWAVMI